MTDQRGQLRVGAHVLVQLGSELVTDVEQALLECVKNAYDADSPGCSISIDTRAVGEIEDIGAAGELAQFKEPAENVTLEFLSSEGERIRGKLRPDQQIRRQLRYRGRIQIEDKGTGISFEDLSKSWLVISASIKRQNQDGPKKKTSLGRTPLGDKGLGRLGTMKLGDILLVESATDPKADISSAWFRWADCEQARTIDEIPVSLSRTHNAHGFRGTRVSILGLKDIEEWQREDRLTEITRSLARLISPFEAASTFPVTVELDGGEQSLALVTEALLARAVADFQFEWKNVDGKAVLIARARVSRRLLTSQRTKALRERTERVFEQDGGKAFAAYLKGSRRISGYYNSKIDPDDVWFAEIEHHYTGSDLLKQSKHSVQNPGAFSGAFYFFHFVGDDADRAGAVAGTGANLRLVRELAGISILRDGFQVRNRGDWLSLSAGMTSGSTYNMRPENTLGFFALTGEKNFRLVEKSDREGFVDNPALRGFMSVARTCRDFANDALVNVRRSLDEYDKELREKAIEENEPSSKSDFAQVGSIIEASLSVGKVASTLAKEISELAEPDGDTPIRRELIQTLAAEIRDLSSPSEELGGEPTKLLDRIESEVEESRARAIALVESAAAGLASRGLTHELRAHLAEIRHNVRALEQGGASARDWLSRLTSIRRSCAAIAHAASQVDPLIPRSREVKQKFGALGAVRQYFDSRSDLYSSLNINVDVSGDEIDVRMNEARLLQVIDNLVRNSVFWLGQLPKNRKREIVVRATNRGLTFADNGPGIDPLVEETLFDLFVTTRQQEEGGQGLGLFIASELLAFDNCNIALLPDRNKSKRRYKFIIDLTAVRLGK